MKCSNVGNIDGRKETYNETDAPNGRWRKYSCSEIMQRDKTSLDITWIKQQDDSSDVTLSQLMKDIRSQSDNIGKAVAELEKLLAGIEE